MATLPKTQAITPTQGTDPWSDGIDSLFLSFDSMLFANREDRNLFLLEGGTVTVTIPGGGGPGTADVFWTAPFVLKGWEGPGQVNIDVPGGPITLVAGQALYCDLTRPPNSTVLVQAQVADFTAIRASNSKLVVGLFWTDGRFYFRNGSSIGGSGGPILPALRSREENFVAAPAQASFLLVGSGGGTQFPVNNEPMHLMVHMNGVYEPNVNIGLATTVFPNDTVTVAWFVPPVGGETVSIAYEFVP
jgi:hypothetical protein